MENYKFKKIQKFLKPYIKMEKIMIKIINQKYINDIVVYNEVSFGKKGFKYFIGYKDAKELDHYVYFSPKQCIEKRLWQS